MKDVSKKRRFNEEVSGQRRAEDQDPPVERPPFQPQAPRFDKINSRDFFALPEQRLDFPVGDPGVRAPYSL